MDGITTIYAVGAAVLGCAAGWRAIPMQRQHRAIVITLRVAAAVLTVLCVAESGAWIVVGAAAVVGVAVGVVLPRGKAEPTREGDATTAVQDEEPRQRQWWETRP